MKNPLAFPCRRWYNRKNKGVQYLVATKKKTYFFAICIAVLLSVLFGIYLLWPHAQSPREISAEEAALRQQFVTAAQQWLGANEADGSHRAIIDLYNSHLPLARNYAVQYDDAWCATFVSAVSIACGWTDIIPTECGCQRQIELFVAKNAWIEDDDYVPLVGDILYYSQDGANVFGDNQGWADHVGIVVRVEGETITTIEGNYNDCVQYRTVTVGDRYIRGYASPAFDTKIAPAPRTTALKRTKSAWFSERTFQRVKEVANPRVIATR